MIFLIIFSGHWGRNKTEHFIIWLAVGLGLWFFFHFLLEKSSLSRTVFRMFLLISLGGAFKGNYNHGHTCSTEMTVEPFFIPSLRQRNTSPSKWGELIGVLFNQSCTSCYVVLMFTRRQFNLLWLTLPWGGQKDLVFAPPGGAIPSEVITGIPAGVICLLPQLMLCKCLAQVYVPEHLFAAKI